MPRLRATAFLSVIFAIVVLGIAAAATTASPRRSAAVPIAVTGRIVKQLVIQAVAKADGLNEQSSAEVTKCWTVTRDQSFFLAVLSPHERVTHAAECDPTYANGGGRWRPVSSVLHFGRSGVVVFNLSYHALPSCAQLKQHRIPANIFEALQTTPQRHCGASDRRTPRAGLKPRPHDQQKGARL